MTKEDINHLVLWLQEKKELTEFRDRLKRCSETTLLKTTATEITFIITSRTKMFKEPYILTDIQLAKLWAFLDQEIKYIDSLIEAADPGDREFAEDIINGNVGKSTIGLK